MIKGFFSKKVFLFVFLVIAFCPRESWAANRYWIGGTGNWSDTAHWSNKSGGAGNKSVPGSSDVAKFDGSSGGGTCIVDQTVSVRGLDMQSGNTTTLSQGANNFTVGTGNAAFTGGTFTGGSSTIDVNGTFTVNGAGFTSTSGTMFCAKAFTFSSGTFTHNSGTVEFDTNNLAISPGSAIFNNVTFNANKTFTIASGQTLTVNGTLNLTDGTVNTGTLGSKGAINLATTFDGGSATLDISGTSGQTFTGGGSASTGDCVVVDINKTSGTLTLASTIRTGSDWTYTQGTVDAGGSTVVFADNNLSITGSMNFNYLTFDSGGGNKTVTIGAGTTLTITGALSLTNYTINGGTLAPEGNVTIGASADGGTTSLSLTATGDQTITGNSGGDFQDNLTINKSSGTVTLTGTCTGIQNITVTVGTLDFDGGFTYTIDNADIISVVSGAAINFTGSSGSLVTLRSDQNNSAWTLNVNTGATYQADFVDVKDSNATGQDIFATNSTDSGGNTNWFIVDAISQIVFTTSPQTLVQNQISSVITVQTQNSSGDAVNVTSDTTLDLTSSSAGGTFSDNSSFTSTITQITISSGQSTAEFYYRDSQVGTPTLTASENPSQGWTDAAQQSTISANVSSFSVTVSSPQIAGSNFTVTITALDNTGVVFTGYSGTANMTVSYVSPDSGLATLGVTSTSAFVEGVATLTNQTFSDCGTITITATDASDATVTGITGNILFVPFDFTVAGTELDDTASALHTVNKPFTLTVTARNAAGTTCPNYLGSTALTVNTISPAADQSGALNTTTLSSTNWTNGVAVITDMIYDKWGTITITSTDTTLTTQTGISVEITFIPKDLLLTLSAIPAFRTYFYIDEEFSAIVTARDFNDASISNYQGTVTFAGDDLALPDDYTFTAVDAGIHLFETSAGSDEIETTLTVTDTVHTIVTAVSEAITIKQGTIQVISTSGPVGTVSVNVQLLDANGEILLQDSATIFTVVLEEFLADNASATSPAETIAVSVSQGKATIAVTDDEAETVTVTPISDPILIPQDGTVQFGTVSRTGVGVQLYREIP